MGSSKKVRVGAALAAVVVMCIGVLSGCSNPQEDRITNYLERLDIESHLGEEILRSETVKSPFAPESSTTIALSNGDRYQDVVDRVEYLGSDCITITSRSEGATGRLEQCTGDGLIIFIYDKEATTNYLDREGTLPGFRSFASDDAEIVIRII